MIDLDKLVPLPERNNDSMYAWNEDDLRAVRLATWNAALEAAANDCSAFHGYHTAVQAQICEDLAESIRAMCIEPQK